MILFDGMYDGSIVKISDGIAELKAGRMVIVTDSEDRENEGDLVMIAEDVTPKDVNFMATYGRGLICVPLTEDRAKKMNLAPMVVDNEDLHKTAFTISVDAKDVTTTGISAQDRYETIKKLASIDSSPEDFQRPGHIFPLTAKSGGVLVRAGHTEASVDLAMIAGKSPVAVICEIMNEDGTMARMPDLKKFAKEHNIKIITIKDLIEVRRRKEKMVSVAASSNLPTEYGNFKVTAYDNILNNKTHIALTMGDLTTDEAVLVRVHSECLTGDIFHSLRCDCGPQLNAALKQIAEVGTGCLLYMRQEGRGIGLVNKLKAYQYQDEGLDTVEANEKLGFEADLRDYGIGAQILVDLGLKKLNLLTNNPRKVVGLEGYGLEISNRVPLKIKSNPYNEKYLHTKSTKLGHFF